LSGTGRSLFGKSFEGIFAPHMSPTKLRLNNHRSAPGTRTTLNTVEAISPPFRKSQVLEPKVQIVNEVRSLPNRLVLNKNTATNILPEAFDIVEGRKRQFRKAPAAVGLQIGTKPEPAPILSVPITSSLTPIMKGQQSRSFANHSLDIPLLQPQSSVAIRRQDSMLGSSQMLQSIVHSMHDIFDRPFQEFPANVDIPELSELALATGVIMDSFLNKRSSTFGLWQRVSFIFAVSFRQ
jgi:hypothetical protein